MLSLLIAIVAVQAAHAASSAATIKGTFNDALVGGDGMAVFELGPSSDRDVPGLAKGDRVYTANLPQFRPPGAVDGLLVAYVEGERGGTLFIDTNLDGRFQDKEGSRDLQAGSLQAGDRGGRADRQG